MTIRLRGHHLLCLLGFRGMGYSEAFAANMAQVHTALRTHPESVVEITAGGDDLCACFPADQVDHCCETTVSVRDAAVLQRLGLEPGNRLSWSEIWSRLQTAVEPADIGRWCGTCPWRPLGVCEEGIRKMRASDGLPPLL